MEHSFKECTKKPEAFFNILPEDWQEGIVPFWAEYRHTARIFILTSATEVVGGGIVFSTVSPDTQPMYKDEAQQWFDNGYLYIGFLWFSEKHRGKQLGTKWLQAVEEVFPSHGLWLAVDDIGLASFYNRNGFDLIKKVELDYYPEWVMAKHQEELVMVPKQKQQVKMRI